jgi:hypothetical protein
MALPQYLHPMTLSTTILEAVKANPVFSVKCYVNSFVNFPAVFLCRLICGFFREFLREFIRGFLRGFLREFLLVLKWPILKRKNPQENPQENPQRPKHWFFIDIRMGIHRPAQQPAGSLPRHTPSPSRAAKSQVLHRHSHGCSPACPAACHQVAGPLPPTHISRRRHPQSPTTMPPLPRNQPTSSSQPLSPVLCSPHKGHCILF